MNPRLRAGQWNSVRCIDAAAASAAGESLIDDSILETAV
jgi:hypothetical protein